MRSISPRRVWHRSMTVPVYSVGRSMRHRQVGLLDPIDLGRRRHLGGVVHLDAPAVGQLGQVLHARGGGDERQVELPLQALPHDLHMQQAEEAAAEAEAEGAGGLRL